MMVHPQAFLLSIWANASGADAAHQVEGVGHMVEQQFERYLEASFSPGYTLFRREDLAAWVVFTLVFVVLIAFDNIVLHRHHKALTVKMAALYTLFWIACAGCFCGYIYWRSGADPAMSWMSGYMLEWMLSFDNLFVFHLIFSVYATPDYLKHRPLYLGICGAVFFRLLFIFVGEYLMHAMIFAHFIFGAFLLWTGIKSATMDDEDEDPSQHWLVALLCRRVPFVNAYDANGAFFVRAPVSPSGQVLDVAEAFVDQESAPLKGKAKAPKYRTVDFSVAHASGVPCRWRATMLFLVVICLEVSDLLFAVDSVSAIVAAVNDLFLAYTSAVFAMLGLRATFFVIDVLVQLFSLLKYGVAAVLCFIGAKLIIGKIYHIPPGVVCLVLFTALAGSMVASVIRDRYFPQPQDTEEGEASTQAA